MQSHFTRHGVSGVDLASRERRTERQGERYPRGGAVFRHRAGGDVDMYVLLVPFKARQPVMSGTGFQVREGGRRRFLHDVAEVSGICHIAGALHDRRFDEDDVSPRLRPGKADRRTDGVFLRHLCVMELRGAEDLPDTLLGEGALFLRFIFRQLGGDLPRRLREFAVKRADARFHRVG
ncbi:hypothetical protein SDC9_135309 [bioreactor metagenome]|uniref:Uncharacterized protein n=1 Tax=bioreactor metagenome TaxID=1076179 RepID=A0A645DGP2_9ZZZZ